MKMFLPHFATIATVISFSNTILATCDLERFFSEKPMSVEEATINFPIVFRGVSVATPGYAFDGEFRARFELLNTFKDASSSKDRWSGLQDLDSRRVNVTIIEKAAGECEAGITSPVEYIVFGRVFNGNIIAASAAKWNERTDQRVWATLGWSEWSDWSLCSVSCSSGIQQRFRRCLSGNCSGYNVEQRHCNSFRCDTTINPLELEDGRFFHPSKDRWKSAPDRASAWRLEPFTYLWAPTVALLDGVNVTDFPKQFSLFFTVRLHNESSGSILSLRSRTQQDAYFSVDLRKTDLKIAHATQNTSDTLIIPVDLTDRHFHRVAISLRDGNVVDCFVDCEWIGTDVLRSMTMEIPDDSDLIIGYLFAGDIEQLSIVTDPETAKLHCSRTKIPIIDPNMEVT